MVVFLELENLKLMFPPVNLYVPACWEDIICCKNNVKSPEDACWEDIICCKNNVKSPEDRPGAPAVISSS